MQTSEELNCEPNLCDCGSAALSALSRRSGAEATTGYTEYTNAATRQNRSPRYSALAARLRRRYFRARCAAIGVEEERLINRTMIDHRRHHLPVTDHLPEVGVLLGIFLYVGEDLLHVVDALRKEFAGEIVARLPHRLVTAQVIEFDN